MLWFGLFHLMWSYGNKVLQKGPTVTAQALLVKTPDEVSTQVTPCQLGVAVGLEVMACHRVSCVGPGRLNADVVADQTDSVEVAGVTVGRCRSGRRCSQLNGVIYAQVLQLNQLTLGHPVLWKHTEMSGESFQSTNKMVSNTFIQEKRYCQALMCKRVKTDKKPSGLFIKPIHKGRKEYKVANSILWSIQKKWCPVSYLLGANGEKQINNRNLMQGFTWLSGNVGQNGNIILRNRWTNSCYSECVRHQKTE